MKRKILKEFPDQSNDVITNDFSYIRNLMMVEESVLIPQLSNIPIKDKELFTFLLKDTFDEKNPNIYAFFIKEKENKNYLKVIGYSIIYYENLFSDKFEHTEKKSFSFKSLTISKTFISRDFTGYGIAGKLYEYIVLRHGSLASGKSLSYDAKKLWSRLINKRSPKYSVFITYQKERPYVFDYFYDLDENDVLPFGVSFFSTSHSRIVLVRKNSVQEKILKELRNYTNRYRDFEDEFEKDVEDVARRDLLKRGIPKFK